MTRKRALVTGGAGFIGHHLVKQLVAAGHHVSVIDPKANQVEFPAGTEIHLSSILDPAEIARAAGDADWILHLAGLAHLWAKDPNEFDRANVVATRHLIDWAKSARPEKLVITSTEVILRGWANPSRETLTEAEASPELTAMAGPYSRSKFKADQIVRAAADAGLPVVSLYPTVPIGTGDRWSTAPTQMLKLFLNKPPPAYLECTLNLVPVIDVARAHILAAQLADPGERFILSGENVAISTLIDWVQAYTDKAMPSRRIPYTFAYLAAIAAEGISKFTGTPPAATIEGVRLARHPWQISSEQARERLGWTPGPVKDALCMAARQLSDSK